MILAVCPNPSIDTSLHFEAFEAGAVNRARERRAFPGGKGVHVALAAAELGTATTLTGFFAGSNGRWLAGECEARGVRCRGVSVAGVSRSCFTFKVPGAYDDTEILEPGPQVNGTELQALCATVRQLAGNARVVAMSGSWPRGAPPEAYARVIASVSQHEEKVVVDATGDALRAALAQRPWCVHVNVAECRELFGDISGPEEGARTLAEQCELAVVSNGADGAYAAAADGCIHASCPVEHVISAVGSGDCLVAGIAHARAAGAVEGGGVRNG